jgi:hypothetical protein
MVSWPNERSSEGVQCDSQGENILETRISAEIELREPRSKLANLKSRPYLLSDPEELVHLDWSEECHS